MLRNTFRWGNELRKGHTSLVNRDKGAQRSILGSQTLFLMWCWPGFRKKRKEQLLASHRFLLSFPFQFLSFRGLTWNSRMLSQYFRKVSPWSQGRTKGLIEKLPCWVVCRWRPSFWFDQFNGLSWQWMQHFLGGGDTSGNIQGLLRALRIDLGSSSFNASAVPVILLCRPLRLLKTQPYFMV